MAQQWCLSAAPNLSRRSPSGRLIRCRAILIAKQRSLCILIHCVRVPIPRQAALRERLAMLSPAARKALIEEADRALVEQKSRQNEDVSTSSSGGASIRRAHAPKSTTARRASRSDQGSVGSSLAHHGPSSSRTTSAGGGAPAAASRGFLSSLFRRDRRTGGHERVLPPEGHHHHESFSQANPNGYNVRIGPP